MTRYVCTRVTITGDRYTIKTTNPKELEDWTFRSLAQGSTSLIEVRVDQVKKPKADHCG